MSRQYANLHTHTKFSRLDGIGLAEKYFPAGKERGLYLIASTDHGNMWGIMPWLEAAEGSGVIAGVGEEFYMARKTRWDRDEEELSGQAEFEWQQRGPYHLTVVAKNKIGFRNLSRLSSKAYTEGFYGKPRIDWELLELYGEGLIIGSGCLNGPVQQALMRGDYEAALAHAARLRDIAGDSFFMELQDHGLKEQAAVKDDTLRIAKTLGALVVPTCDCHYVSKDEHLAHDVSLCVGTKAVLSQEKRFKFHGPEFYLKSYDEMEAIFGPEYLKNSLILAEQVDYQPEFGEYHFPSYPDVPEGQTSAEYMEELAWDGLKPRYGDPLPEHVTKQAAYELDVITSMGFPDYFLVVWDLIRWMKDMGIRTTTRGSAAASVISYALQITKLDPLQFGLIFERFLIKGRKTMPDIDIDVDDRFRQKVIEYARERYGPDRVAHIATFATILAKSAIKDAGRILEYPFEIQNKVSNLVPPPVLGKTKTLDECMQVREFREAYESNSDVRKIVDVAKSLEGLVRQTGIHAGGIVITPGPVEDYIPVMRLPQKDGTMGPLTTQYDMDGVEQNGLLKIDFLGLRNLGIIEMTTEHIEERHVSPRGSLQSVSA